MNYSDSLEQLDYSIPFDDATDDCFMCKAAAAKRNLNPLRALTKAMRPPMSEAVWRKGVDGIVVGFSQSRNVLIIDTLSEWGIMTVNLTERLANQFVGNVRCGQGVHISPNGHGGAKIALEPLERIRPH